MHWDAKKIQILPFYNTFIEKPNIKKLSNVKLLQELPFYNELIINSITRSFNMIVKNQYNSKIDLLKLIFPFHLPETIYRVKLFFINKFKNLICKSLKNIEKHNKSY